MSNWKSPKCKSGWRKNRRNWPRNSSDWQKNLPSVNATYAPKLKRLASRPRQVTRFLVEIFRSPDPEQDGRKITVAEMLDKAKSRVETEFTDDRLLQARLLQAIEEIYQGLGLVRESVELAEKTYHTFLDMLGPEHPDTLTAMSNLAQAYVDAGHSKEKTDFIEESFQLHKQVLGLEHRDTLEAMAIVIVAFLATGRLDEALSLCEENLRLRKKAFGSDDPDTSEAMSILAGVCHRVGQFDRALSLNEETLKLQEKRLARTIPIRSAHEIRWDFRTGGCAVGRKKLRSPKRRCNSRREELGADHPKTLVTMNNLACVYEAVGRVDEALQIMEEALQLDYGKMGCGASATLSFMRNLANFYGRVGKVARSIPLFEKTLNLKRKVLGEDHPDTLGYHGLAQRQL